MSTEGARTMRHVVRVAVEIDLAAYRTEYGHSGDQSKSLAREAKEYATDQVRGAAAEHMARLGWATVQEAD